MEVEKLVSLEDKIAAARERRERLQKERDTARQDTGISGCFMWNDDESANRVETAARRKSEIQAQHNAQRQVRRDSLSNRHDEARERREVQMRQKREKALNDIEKGEQRSKEAKRKQRWSWNGAVHGGGDDLEKMRPTAMPRSMQSWIGSLRSFAGDDDDDSLNGSTMTTPRDCKSINSSFAMSGRLLTPTAASKAKRFEKPDGQNSSSTSVNGDAKESKLRRRTISHEHLNRLAQPRLRTASSERQSSDPKQKFNTSGRITPQRSRTTSRDSRPKPDGSDSPKDAQKNPKTPDANFENMRNGRPQKTPQPRSVTPRHPRTSGVGAPKPDAKKVNPKAGDKNSGNMVKSSIHDTTLSTKQKKSQQAAEPKIRIKNDAELPPVSINEQTSPTIVKDVLELSSEDIPVKGVTEDPTSDTKPDTNLSVTCATGMTQEVLPEMIPLPEETRDEKEEAEFDNTGLKSKIDFRNINLHQAMTRDTTDFPNDSNNAVLINFGTQNLRKVHTRVGGVPVDIKEETQTDETTNHAEQPIIDINVEESSDDSSFPQPTTSAENPLLSSVKAPSAVSLVSSSFTSLASESTEATETELHIEPDKDVEDIASGEKIQKTVSFDDKVAVSTALESSQKERKKKEKKPKSEDEKRKKKEKQLRKKKKKDLEAWLNTPIDSSQNGNDVDAAGIIEVGIPESVPEPAQPSEVEVEDEYKRRLREKKEKYIAEQESREQAAEAEKKRLEDEAAASRLDMESQAEEQKKRIEDHISENVRQAEVEREEKRQAEEKERLARKKRIEEIMKRTKRTENAFPSSSEINDRISQRQNNGNQEIDDVGARARSLLAPLQSLRMGESSSQSQEQINTEGS